MELHNDNYLLEYFLQRTRVCNDFLARAIGLYTGCRCLPTALMTARGAAAAAAVEMELRKPYFHSLAA